MLYLALFLLLLAFIFFRQSNRQQRQAGLPGGRVIYTDTRGSDDALYAKLEPLQLTFSLMTRSKRITWANLKQRDPKLVDQVDAWFAKQQGTKPNGDGSVPPPFALPQGCRFHPRCPVAIEKCSHEEPQFLEVNPDHFVACWLAE